MRASRAKEMTGTALSRAGIPDDHPLAVSARLAANLAAAGFRHLEAGRIIQGMKCIREAGRYAEAIRTWTD
jgi:hypothetical protein